MASRLISADMCTGVALNSGLCFCTKSLKTTELNHAFMNTVFKSSELYTYSKVVFDSNRSTESKHRLWQKHDTLMIKWSREWCKCFFSSLHFTVLGMHLSPKTHFSPAVMWIDMIAIQSWIQACVDLYYECAEYTKMTWIYSSLSVRTAGVFL